MANWKAITIDDLKTEGHGAIIDAAQATAAGSIDPVTAAIAHATARIRAAISKGNSLDSDSTKIPNSLVGLACRICVRKLKQRIEYALSQDERDERKEDEAYLNRISIDAIRFESPDAAGGDAEIQPGVGTVETVGCDRPRLNTRETMSRI